MLAETDSKRCSHCGQHLPLTAYNRDASRTDGLRSQCRACVNEYRQVWRDSGEHGEYEKRLGPHEQYVIDHAQDEWKARGLCATIPLGLTEDGVQTTGEHFADRVRAWYPGDVWGSTAQAKFKHEALLRDICSSCPVYAECAMLARHEPWGFLAGKTERQRKDARVGS